MLSHDPLITDLLMYSTGLSLLQGVHSMNEAQDALHALISKLKASSLLLDSFSNDHFTMHDVFREFALSVAFEKQGAVVVRHKEQNDLQSKTLLKDCTRLCLDKSGITQLPNELDCPRLEFFLIRDENLDLGIPSTFFRSTKELKVMNISNIHFECLPSSLSHLQKLRTLSLHSCLLKDIAEVGNLNNLTILSLANSDIQQLPSELAGLTCLQMLNLAHCSKLKVIPPKLLSSLRRLEVLDMTDSFNRWKAEGSSKGNEIENASLSELKDLTSLSSLNIHIPNTFVLPKDLFLHSTLERYNILIGESWEWSASSGECETSKTLKLKLRSNIHLEHGIQKLLESVEDLHIDELNGIINVLYDLHGEGFPHLKHLKIENIDQIEYIVSHSRRRVEVFPNLETLNLIRLNELKKLCQGWILAASFKNLKKIIVDGCRQLKSIFSSLTVGSFCQLVGLQIESCKSIEGIVVFTNEDSSGCQRTASDVIVFQQLSTLRMSSLPMLSAFCLEETATNTDECKRKLKSLFGSEISFPKLETVNLDSINSEQLWDHRLPQNAFCNLKTLTVIDCPFLVKLVPLHVLRSLCRLEELWVSDCSSLEIVFDFEELNGNNKEIQLPSCVVPLKTLDLYSLPKLKHVWSNDPKEMVSFPSLRRVMAYGCQSLKSMFPASIAKGLLQLERLHLLSCGVDVIVAKDEKVSESDAATFVFPKLTYLGLVQLHNLRNFYPYGHMSEWPQLQHLEVRDCDGLEIFQKEVSSSSTLQEDAQEIKYPLLLHDKVIPNLMKLELGGKHGMMIWNGQFPAYHFHKVQHLSVELDDSTTFPYGLNNNSFPNLQELELSWGYMKELKFSSVEPIGDDVGQVALPPITTLTLHSMPNLKHIWNENSELHFILPNLQSLNVSYCRNLMNLGPSFISFDNLTDISVSYCHRLINLITSSTSRSLVQLTRLEIRNCEQIEEIITKQEEVRVDDVEKEIVFQKLQYLRLQHLKSLRSFCSHCYTLVFPSLQEVTIQECGRMSMFCPGDIHTPLLKVVAFEKKKEDKEDQKLWDTNLNKTVQLLITQVTELKMCPEMRNMWVIKPPLHMAFRRLKELTVDNCDFLSEYVIPTHLIRSLSNLKILEVRNCHAIKTIFELKEIDMEEEIHNSLENIGFEVLKLDHLPNLKCVWPEEVLDGSNCFQYLKELYVEECESLRNIFAASTAKGLTRLEKLTIISCGVEVIVSEDNTYESLNFVFSQLSYLSLEKLPHLKHFYPQRCLFEWPRLTNLLIFKCENLQVFGTDLRSSFEPGEANEIKTQPPLFLVEKAIPQLKRLSLSQKDVNLIQNAQFEASLFDGVEVLCLESFLQESNAFPYSFLERFSNLDELIVKYSSFEEILSFQVQSVDHARESAPFKKLCLAYLDQLNTIWNDDDYQLQPLHQNLESLKVECCSNLIKLTPSSASFENLTNLKVSGCHQLIYLVTNSTAKSLVNLEILKIVNCRKMEEIVRNESKDGAEGGITFNKLGRFKLIGLPSLKCFCSENQTLKFPELWSVTINECDQMKMFCPGALETPKLRHVEIEGEEIYFGGSNRESINMLLEKVHTCMKGSHT